MDAEQLFLQFQQTREPACLGAVFDLVADDLFGFALHLCRDQAEAEDLLQATFLVALERAHRYDGKRPLRPWLLGILQREARGTRRRARRTPDPERLAAPTALPPVQVVLSSEVVEAVAAGIASVPQPYRAVLELRLVQSLENGEIAARLRRSPGSVRTQLWRGLELLRRLLPKGLAVALAAQLSRPGLAAVRQRVLHRASSAGIAGAGLLIGALLMKKVAIAVTSIAVLAAGWWAWPRAAAAFEASAIPSPDAGVVATPDEQPHPAARTLVAAEAGTAPATEAKLTPVTVNALVVDAKGDPVADAEVSLFAAQLFKDQAGNVQPARYVLPAPPVWIAHTDTLGRLTFTIHQDCFVSARKDQVGASGDVRVHPGMAELREQLRIQLYDLCHIRGLVLLPDGAPAVGVSVGCNGGCFQGRHLADSLRPAMTDAEGRFTFEVLRGMEYVLSVQRAEVGVVHASAAVEVDARTGGPEYPVTLRLAGAYSVRGVLLDALGQPTAGQVRMVSHPPRRVFEDKETRGWAFPKADGRFEILLNQAGSYHVTAGVKGQTAAHLVVALDDANRHEQIVLRLQPFAAIAGRVVDEKGVPCADVVVSCAPMVVMGDPLPRERFELEGQLHAAVTAADGSFRIMVPAGCSYRLGYRPSRQLWAWGPELTPPTQEALLVKRHADGQGFEVEGQVVSAATGASVNQVNVLLITHADGDYDRKEDLDAGSNGTFATGPLVVGQRYSENGTPPAGQRYSLRISVAGFADALIGPFEPTVRKERVTVRMQAWSSVLCTVLRPDGTPAVKAEVTLRHARGRFWFDRDLDGETDSQGRVRVEQLPAGDFTIKVVGAANGGKAEGNVTTLAGQETKVQVTLRQ